MATVAKVKDDGVSLVVTEEFLIHWFTQLPLERKAKVAQREIERQAQETSYRIARERMGLGLEDPR